MESGLVFNWGIDWAWGLPLIVLTTVFHAYGLGFINKHITPTLDGPCRPSRLSVTRVLVMGGTALWATLLHGFEGFLWAIAYLLLGAVQGYKSAMLYSLGAMTTYGHEAFQLAPRWQLMGALEALNGWILFGLTTAFIFTIMQKLLPRN
jgi:hypothetical protein